MTSEQPLQILRSSQKLLMLAKSITPVKLTQFSIAAEEEDKRTPTKHTNRHEFGWNPSSDANPYETQVKAPKLASQRNFLIVWIRMARECDTYNWRFPTVD
jgi:hypothetical protein